MATARRAAAAFDTPEFLDRLRQGDSEAYRLVIRRFHGSLVGVAAAVTGSRALAEEVVQDAWIAVMGAIGGFEGRASLASWLFRIVLNRARSRVVRESRMVTLDLAAADGGGTAEPDAAAPRFKPDGHWHEEPRLWDAIDPERIVGGREVWAHVQDAIARLPPGPKAVVILRDIEGQDAAETCRLLQISPENQRVLLHRGRDRIRRAIDALMP